MKPHKPEGSSTRGRKKKGGTLVIGPLGRDTEKSPPRRRHLQNTSSSQGDNSEVFQEEERGTPQLQKENYHLGDWRDTNRGNGN